MFSSWNSLVGGTIKIFKELPISVKKSFLQSGCQGAQTTIHVVLSGASSSTSSVKLNLNGKYFSDCREEKLMVSRRVGDVKFEATLWAKTLKMLDVDFNFEW